MHGVDGHDQRQSTRFHGDIPWIGPLCGSRWRSGRCRRSRMFLKWDHPRSRRGCGDIFGRNESPSVSPSESPSISPKSKSSSKSKSKSSSKSKSKSKSSSDSSDSSDDGPQTKMGCNDQTEDMIPNWGWFLLGMAGMLIAGGIIAFCCYGAMRRHFLNSAGKRSGGGAQTADSSTWGMETPSFSMSDSRRSPRHHSMSLNREGRLSRSHSRSGSRGRSRSRSTVAVPR